MKICGSSSSLGRTVGRARLFFQQPVLGRPIAQTYGINFPESPGVRLPDLSPLCPPARHNSDQKDFDRHYRLFQECLERTGDALPILVTDDHYFSLPFYRAISDAPGGQGAAIVALDTHLDGFGASYTEWGFWGFGIVNQIISAGALTIIGSHQLESAKSFAGEYNCEGATSSFEYADFLNPDNEDHDVFLTGVSRKVKESFATEHLTSIVELRGDTRLRNFAEYAYLKNAGATVLEDLPEKNLADQPVFVSFDTDVELSNEKLMSLARRLSAARLVGVHISELRVGAKLHGPRNIEKFIETLTA